MKILVVSPKGDGTWYAWLLRNNGHDVDCYIVDPRFQNAFTGLIPQPLTRIPQPGDYDLVVFDASSQGEDADYAASITPTIGSSSLADRLEDDRIFGLEVMEQAGIKVPEWKAFDSPESGIAWLEKTRKRTVFKPIGDVDDKATTYCSKSSEDMIAFMERVFQKSKIRQYVLQEFVVGGTECAACGWFNGDDWVLVDHNLEEKKLMSGNIGPNTGCAGMVVWIPPRPTPLFQQGLERVTPFLREVDYVGPIDLNTIVTPDTAYGLEWTPRFGYEGTPNLVPLLPIEFGEFLHRVATGQSVTIAQPRAAFSATIRCAVPPYPNAEDHRKKLVVPVHGIDLTHLERFFLDDVRMAEDGALETTGAYNHVGSPICTGESIHEALDACEHVLKGLDVPDLMWRNDLEKCIGKRYTTLQQQGWLRAIG